MEISNYILLIWKRLRGEISANEQSELEHWIAQSPENKQEQARVEKIWEKTGDANKTFQIDLDSDFEKIKARIRAEERIGDGKVQSLRLWRKSLLRVAAALAVLFAAFWLLRSPKQAESQILFAETSKGNTQMLSLSDGSKIWLHDQSRLDYPQNFDGKQRLVRLSGEAFFEVAHDASKPFLVLMPDGSQVEVLGTQFFVSSNPDDQDTKVLVKSGKVRFSAKVSPKAQVVLTAKQQGEFQRKTGEMHAISVNTLNELAWHQGGLSFEHTPLSDVFNDFEKHFNIHVEVENKSLLDCPYSAPLITQNAENALQAIAIVFNMKLKKTGEGSFRMSGGGCK